MLIVLTPTCTADQRRRVVQRIESAGCRAEETHEAGHSILTVNGDLDRLREIPIEVYAGVQKVVWITPQGAAGNRKAGIGVQFADTQDGAHARTVIESHLASMLKSNVATHTM